MTANHNRRQIFIKNIALWDTWNQFKTLLKRIKCKAISIFNLHQNLTAK